MQADLVQLVQRLEPWSLGATVGTPARDGGSVLTWGGHAQHDDEQGASRRCARRGGVWSSHLERESSGLVEESAQGGELEERVELGQLRLLLVAVHRVVRKSKSCGRRSERRGLPTEHLRT